MPKYPCILIAVCLIAALQACGLKSSEDYRREANELEKRGQYREAIRLLDQALEKDPKNIKALLDRGVDYAMLEHFDSAVADYSRVISLDGHNVLAFLNRGKNKKRMENFAAAVTDFNSAIALKGGEKVWLDKSHNPLIDNGFEFDAKMEEIRFERGIAYFYLGKMQSALGDINFAMSEKYAVPECYFWRGFIFIQTGEEEKGCLDLQKSAELGDANAKEEWKRFCQ